MCVDLPASFHLKFVRKGSSELGSVEEDREDQMRTREGNLFPQTTRGEAVVLSKVERVELDVDVREGERDASPQLSARYISSTTN